MKDSQILTEAHADKTVSSERIFKWYKRFLEYWVIVENVEPAGRSRKSSYRMVKIDRIGERWISVTRKCSGSHNPICQAVSDQQKHLYMGHPPHFPNVPQKTFISIQINLVDREPILHHLKRFW
ncbi:hypothetical protein TNCV_105771 [Trichonephila clavipes]|nr:hypothetical protein TNCV_105771 [Trichonephila clavipes]